MTGRAPSWLRRRLDPDARYGLRLSALATAFLLVAVPFGWLLNQVERSGFLVELDTAAADSFHAWATASPEAVSVLKAVTAVGSTPSLYLLTLAGVAVLLRSGRRRLVAFLVVTALGSGLLNTAVKEAVNRPRPSFVDPVASARGKAFPSAHAMNSTAVGGALLITFRPALRPRRRSGLTVAVASAVTVIAFTRLALGVHYVSDVVGGIVLGLAWLCLSAAAFVVWRAEVAPDEPAAASG